MNIFQPRLEKMWDWMEAEGIALTMFEDAEGRRDKTLRWLCGQPGDALLFLSQDRKTLLVPWDVNLAKLCAHADNIIPYTSFDRTPERAIAGAAERLKIPAGSKIEIPPSISYPDFLNLVGELDAYDIICRKQSAASYTQKLRAVKDPEEIKIIRSAAAITNSMIDLLEKRVRSGKIKTEADAAMFIELESRKRGCEGTSFETLAAGAERSFGIHAFPAWTAAPFAGRGLSILDFGLRLQGYSTDVTLTFIREPDSPQEEMAALVEEAAALAGSMPANGGKTRKTAAAVDALFAGAKKNMPHGLGHGLGLEEHEYPMIRNSAGCEWVFEPGMVFTLEPGLYDPLHGGCRLENDFLMTETGPEKLTCARIIRL
jgi:Xaa-Pro dipeptidase